MPRIVDRDAENLILDIVPRDVAGDPIPSLAHNAAGLSVHWRATASADWQDITLSAGAVGVWSDGGWYHLGDGIYQLGLPNAAIVPGDRTLIRLTYDGRKQYDAIDAIAASVLKAKGPVVLQAVLPTVADTGDMLYFEITARDDYENDNPRGAIGPITVETEIDLLNSAVVDRIRFGACRLYGSRVVRDNDFVGTCFAEAGDAPDTYNIYIELTKDQTNREPAYYRWDVEAVLVDNDVVTLTPGENRLRLHPSMGNNEEVDSTGGSS